MNSIRLVHLAYAVCIAAMTMAGAAAQAYDLTVEVLNARSDKGLVAGALYGTEASWLKDALQGERQPAAARTVLVYRNLPVGPYALSLFHDENGNGKLDSNMIGMPVEAYGFSNNPNVMRKPTWDEARFEVGVQDAAIAITLR